MREFVHEFYYVYDMVFDGFKDYLLSYNLKEIE